MRRYLSNEEVGNIHFSDLEGKFTRKIQFYCWVVLKTCLKPMVKSRASWYSTVIFSKSVYLFRWICKKISILYATRFGISFHM